jgi:hypothetical protein
MKKNETLLLSFTDKEGKVLLERKLTSVPLAEEAVLRLSVEFFSDPEPCMIHRSAVMSRMFMELLEYFLPMLDAGKAIHPLGELPPRLAGFFDLPGFSGIIVARTK